MVHDPRTAAATALTLTGDHLQAGDRRIAITKAPMSGEISHEFGIDHVRFSGWAAASDPEDPVTIHFFADGEHVHSVECDLKAEVASGPEGARPVGFAASIPIEVLQPAEREVTAVAESAAGEAGYLPIDRRSIFPALPLREQSDFKTVVQSPATRVSDPGQLMYLARWGLARFRPGMGHYAAAICVLGYRILEDPDRFERLASEAWIAIDRWNQHVRNPSDGATMRWHISLNTVGGYLALMEGDLDRAASQFRQVAARYGDIARTPISAHNVSISTFLAGWVSYKSGDREDALEYFHRTLLVVRVGLQVQPIETNFYVWNECARMSYLGQQALWMVGHLDAEFAKHALLPDQTSFTLRPVLIRVPQLFKRLPAALKTL